MNPELARQKAVIKAINARVDPRPAPVCRAIPQPVKRERPKLPRGAPPPKRPPPLVKAIEEEHRVRVRCIREAYAAEKDRHRATFVETMRECCDRENKDLRECERYQRELLCEAKDLGVAQ